MIQDVQDGLATLLADLVISLLWEDDILDVGGEDAKVLDYLGAGKECLAWPRVLVLVLRLAKEFDGEDSGRGEAKVGDL